ncbi:MAG: hypothetical protein O6649_01345 [Gammaproteobacteria bacterium]|nr:hypothetical protein [Gammaproteobacteria bacterium]
MLTLAKYALKGQYQAAAVVGILAIVAVFFPLVAGTTFISALVTTVLIVMSGALVGLIILTQGTISGLKAIIVSIFGITLVTWIVLKAPSLGISIALAQWLPIVILAHTLKSTKSLAMMILAGAALATGVAGIQFYAVPDLEAEWLTVIQLSMEQLQGNPAYSSMVVRDNIQLFVHWMVLLMVPAMYLLFVSILHLSRWLQARVAGSDGYNQEFRAIALGKPAAIFAVAVLILSFWLNQDWITSMALIVMAAFLYQGVAVVHSRAVRSKYRAWMIGFFYALLLLFPQVVALTSIVGVIDNWLVFRKNRNIEST